MAVYRVHSGGMWGQKNPGEILPKWINLLDNLISEDFELPVIEKLKMQKNKVFNEYILWALENKSYSQIIKSVNQFYDNKNPSNINFLINILLEHIAASESYIKRIEKSGTFKLSRKISRVKSFFYKN